MNRVRILKDCDSNMAPWPRDQSQNSGQVSEDLYHQKYRSSTIQETKRGCDACAAVCSTYRVHCSCFCPSCRSCPLHIPLFGFCRLRVVLCFPHVCFFVTSVVNFTFCLCPCSKSHLHHPLLTRSPSMSSKHTRPLQQCPCHTLCSRHR